MSMPSILKSPIFVDLDRRRELIFDLNTEALIQGAGKRDSALWTKIGEKKDPKTGEIKDTLDLNVENLRIYLWACLYRDMRANGELLTQDDIGALVNNRRKATAVFLAVREAMSRYYGRDEEEEQGKN
jgi:hypothetical protein